MTARFRSPRILPMTGTLLAIACLSVSTQAHAASSAWFDTEGGRVRLVTMGKEDSRGILRGALEIDLKPGWKTYWRDPGGSGVPPAIDVSGMIGVSALLDFPPPSRHEESDFTWVGYDTPVAFATTFTFNPGTASGPVRAKVFLGVCKTICIPVAADLVVDPALGPDDADDVTDIAAAFAAIPEPARDDFRVLVHAVENKRIILEVRTPLGLTDVDLFVDQGAQYLLGVPTSSILHGVAVFTIDATRPAEVPAGPGLPYTLTAGGKSVSGFIPYF